MTNYNNLKQSAKNIFTSIIIEELEHNCLLEESLRDRYGDLSDLHFKLFNEEYFIVGYYQANKFIEANFSSTFEAIDIVKEYELDHFGEFTTQINSEAIANMLAYIIGEEIIYSLNEEEEVKNIIEQLKSL